MRVGLWLWAIVALGLIGAPPVRASVEEEILNEMNRARAQPALFAKELRAYWDKVVFTEKLYAIPGERIRYMTHEGRGAIDEAIAFLERQRPLPPLQGSAPHALAAFDHAATQGPIGAIGHSGPDGSRPADRVKRRGGDLFYVGEVIYYGATAQTSAADVVRGLIIDDGVPDRGHRKIIFDPEFLTAGAGCGPHQRYGAMCVATFGPQPRR